MIEYGSGAAPVGADVLRTEAKVLEKAAQRDVIGAEESHVDDPRRHAEVGVDGRVNCNRRIYTYVGS